MIWLLFFIPFVIVGGIAIYFEKKSGMVPPEESTEKQIDLIAQQKQQNRKDIGSGGGF